MSRTIERRSGERRRRVDLTSPYVQPGMDRRTGRDRRKIFEFGGDLTKKFKVETNIYKRQIDKLLKDTDKLEEMKKFRSRESEDVPLQQEVTFEIVEEKKQLEQKVFSDTRSFEGKTKAKNKSSWDQFTTKIEEKISHKSKVLTEDKSKTFGILLLSFVVPFFVASHIFQPFIFKIFPFLNIACPILIVVGIYFAFFKS